jgi:acetyl/propionyl-CoA carboxylase alpha subunit
MVVRKLQKYTWSYENGMIEMVDNKTLDSFKFPISYLDSFLRASIAFKNANREEAIYRLINRLNKRSEVNSKLKKSLSESRKNHAQYRATVKEQKKKLTAQLRNKSRRNKIIASQEVDLTENSNPSVIQFVIPEGAKIRKGDKLVVDVI